MLRAVTQVKQSQERRTASLGIREAIGHVVQGGRGGNGVHFSIARQARYRRALLPFRAVMVTPHLLGMIAVYGGAAFAWMAAIIWIAIFRRYPRWAFDYLVGTGRWSLRVIAYMCFLTDIYPPFSLRDVPEHPVRLVVDYPAGRELRFWDPLTSYLRALAFGPPLLLLDFGVMAAAIAAFAAIATTGRLPQRIFDYLVRVLRTHAGVTAYTCCMLEKAPKVKVVRSGE